MWYVGIYAFHFKVTLHIVLWIILLVALLGIPSADNDGTFGALYHLIKPNIIHKLPKGSLM